MGSGRWPDEGSGGSGTGGTVTAANAATLAALSAASYTAGQTAWVTTLGDSFVYELNAATPDGLTIIAPTGGLGGYNWVRQGLTNRTWAAQTTWVVDLQNGTGLASDENTGVDATHPLLTFSELARRLNHAEITARTTIDVRGNQQTTDQPVWTFTCTDDTLFTGKVVFTGQLTSIYTGTVTTYTAGGDDKATDDGDTILDSGLPVSWTASGLLAAGVLFKRTSGGAERFWYAASDEGSKTARIARPHTGAGVEGTLVNGDTFAAYTVPALLRHRFTACQAQGAIVFEQFTMAGPLVFPRPGVVTYSNCWFSVTNFIQPGVFRGCVFGAATTIRGYGNAATLTISAGSMIKGATLSINGITDASIDGRLVVQGASAKLLMNTQTTVSISGNLAFYDTTGIAFEVGYYSRVFMFAATGCICGNTNSGATVVNVTRWSQLTYLTAPPMDAASFTHVSGTPIKIGDDPYAVADLPKNLMDTYGIGFYVTE